MEPFWGSPILTQAQMGNPTMGCSFLVSRSMPQKSFKRKTCPVCPKYVGQTSKCKKDNRLAVERKPEKGATKNMGVAE